MENIIKVAVVVVLSVVLYVVVKQLRAEYAVLVEVGAVAIVAVVAINYLAQVLAEASSLMEISGLGSDCIKVLVKSLGIAVVTQISGDICRDNGISALATCLEITGRVVIVALSVPLIRSVAQLAIELMKS